MHGRCCRVYPLLFFALGCIPTHHRRRALPYTWTLVPLAPFTPCLTTPLCTPSQSHFFHAFVPLLLFARWLHHQYDMAASFITAHKHVVSLFRELVQDRRTCDIVVGESEAMVALAQERVADITVNFTEMARAVKTHHVIFALLKDTENVAKSLLQVSRSCCCCCCCCC